MAANPPSSNPSPQPGTSHLLASIPSPSYPIANHHHLPGEPIDTATTSPDSQNALELAQRLRSNGDIAQARQILVALLQNVLPTEIQRLALLELAQIAQDLGQPTRALQIYAQYLQLHGQHPTAIEVLLRQGRLYRELGTTTLAISKFYAVMTTALSLKLEQLDYYQHLVLQAQSEIAETYHQQGRLDEAADFLARLLKLDSPHLNKPLIQFKLIRTLAALDRHDQTIAQARLFIDRYPLAHDLPEVRFLLANSLKSQGHIQHALTEVLSLLQSHHNLATHNPAAWTYWQKRAGNILGNHLYLQGDYLDSLKVYHLLANLDTSPHWQLPVWYQIGLVHERLHHSLHARTIYSQILNRESELANTDSPNPALQSVITMARWRSQHLDWIESTVTNIATLRPQPDHPL